MPSDWARGVKALISFMVLVGGFVATQRALGERLTASGLNLQRRLVTSDESPLGGGHQSPGGSTVLLPGMPASLNPDGVVSVIDATAGIFCTGALVGDRHVLTSAHCVEVASIYTPDRVSFDTASALTPSPIADIFIHPGYDGSIEAGYDIAVLELANDAPSDAPRYGIYTANDELGRLTVKAGYGRTGHGSIGSTRVDAQRRIGLNTYDATSVDFNNAFGMEMATDSYLLYDFDSGLEENNAWSENSVTSDLGFGVDEVNAVSGDSGGPTFIHDGSEWVIAGVTSWSVGLQTSPPDVTPNITDGSWGEISADARVSSYADFAQAVVDGTYVRPQRYEFSQGVVRPDALWERPSTDGTTLAVDGPVPYHAYTFTVDGSGDYTVESAQNFDGVAYLYESVFDPANPLQGFVSANDNGPDGASGSRLAAELLTAGQTYTVVTSASAAGDVGTFLNTITGPGQVAAVPSSGGFTGAFAPEQWQFETPHAEAHVQLDAVPGSVTIFGGDDEMGGVTNYTITATETIMLDFDWTYFSLDDPGFDIFGVLVNDEFTRLTDGEELYGSHNVALDAGDEFGFRVQTIDGVKGAGIVNLDHFRIRRVGDFNSDGNVDGEDLAQWQGDFGLNANSDADGDNDSDGGDFLAWQRQFGLLGSPGSSSLQEVPEPSSLMLVSSVALVRLTRSRRRAK